ncbi:copper resistance D family protein [Mycobacterium sp. IDR2000157661]|uniref:copper resistance D family protein n=1 Tax=Mycobacterium sp. IDR2000157661 TaxID=2867005 RepID=UPI001EEDAD02|nr:CopD family protein [Mycobacterium sp. IDR2000157661]ULE34872.1 CopD family protein [Mycobacterium sp. IDR2000157661]
MRAPAAGALIAVVAALAAWALAYPQATVASTVIRTLADCAGVLCLGLSVLPMLDGGRRRAELLRRAAAPMTAAGAVWLLVELTRLIVTAGKAAAVPLPELTLKATVDFATATAAGQAGLITVAAAAAFGGLVVALPRSMSANTVVAGVAAIGVVTRQLTGHFAASAVGGLAVTVHTLAAALWCGALAAMVLTVQHRGQWARMLPRFSQLSLGCVLVLTLGGVVGGAVRMGSAAEPLTSGYGRLLAAKIAMTLLLVLLGWRNRTMWLPAAQAHRASADVSGARSRVETALMIVALALAAGLAVTG